MRTCWREKIKEAMEAAKDPGPIIACTLTSEGLDEPFDDGFGGEEGAPFLAWTDTNVYFPVCYDGSEWASCAPRDPTEKGQSHVGGG